MCGIAGQLRFDAGSQVDEGLLRRMCAALAHRGPDGEGIHRAGPVGLGHRRLGVIDPSPAGHQPMSNDDGSVWIVFNGEIYNFPELRRQLESAGVRFRSRTDTEVLLRLYEARGVECLHALRGMFAFAIWDARRRELLLARDRLGVKPLFYHAGAKGLTFASELKALLQDPGIERDVDPVAIHHYLTYQYVPAPFCAIRGIRKLPPAHYLRSGNGALEVRRYWRLDYQPKHEARTPRQLADLEQELLLRLEDAVRCRLISDVPLGAFLSGGIDSAAVVALMSGITSAPVRTFSIGFEERAYDELPAARAVARRFHTDHTEFVVRPDALEILPALVRLYGEPYADASAIPTFVLSRLARRHVTVALTGDGGDESFAGYDRYVANELARGLRGLAAVLGSRWVRRALASLPHGSGPGDLRLRLLRFLGPLGLSPEARNARWLSQFGCAEKEALYAPDFRARVRGVDSWDLLRTRFREAAGAEFLDAVLYADVMTYLPDCLLVKADMATMANGLEARSPFLDHTLMEFAARIPARLKLRGQATKWILKRALRRHLPGAVLRRRKRGFNLPLDEWLRGPLREPAHDLLTGTRSLARGRFRRDTLERMLADHESGRGNRHQQIWTLMMLEMWQREVADPPRAADATAPFLPHLVSAPELATSGLAGSANGSARPGPKRSSPPARS